MCFFPLQTAMTIIYSCLARGTTVLCSNQSGAGSFSDTIQSMLSNIPSSGDGKRTYTANKWVQGLVQSSTSWEHVGGGGGGGYSYLVRKSKGYSYLSWLFVSGLAEHQWQFLHTPLQLKRGTSRSSMVSTYSASAFKSEDPGFDPQVGQGEGQFFYPPESTLVQTYQLIQWWLNLNSLLINRIINKQLIHIHIIHSYGEKNN